MYAIKQIKICAEYRDMLPRPRLDLSGTPGFRPIGFRPGSWQSSLGLGSMSRYSAQILICILDFAYDLLIFLILAPFWLSETRQIWVIVIFFRTHGRNGLKFDMLMYPDHICNWLHLGHRLLVSSFGATLTYWNRSNFWFLENAREECTRIGHVDVFWSYHLRTD